MEKLNSHFTEYQKELDIETNEEISYLLKVLPGSLKTKLAKFMYFDVINVFRFLQNRDDDFYSKYLDQLKVSRFNKRDYIAKAG
jgi:hypothetical protein